MCDWPRLCLLAMMRSVNVQLACFFLLSLWQVAAFVWGMVVSLPYDRPDWSHCSVWHLSLFFLALCIVRLWVELCYFIGKEVWHPAVGAPPHQTAKVIAMIHGWTSLAVLVLVVCLVMAGISLSPVSNGECSTWLIKRVEVYVLFTLCVYATELLVCACLVWLYATA